MAKQLHKRFSDEQVKMLVEKYLDEKVELIQHDSSHHKFSPYAVNFK